MDDRTFEPEPDAGLAIQRALEAAQLRAGDSLGGTTASTVTEWEPSAAEAGDLAGAVDGD